MRLDTLELILPAIKSMNYTLTNLADFDKANTNLAQKAQEYLEHSKMISDSISILNKDLVTSKNNFSEVDKAIEELKELDIPNLLKDVGKNRNTSPIDMSTKEEFTFEIIDRNDNNNRAAITFEVSRLDGHIISEAKNIVDPADILNEILYNDLEKASQLFFEDSNFKGHEFNHAQSQKLKIMVSRSF